MVPQKRHEKGLPVVAKGVANATKTRLVIPFADETLRTLSGIRRGELVHLDGELLTLKVAVKAKSKATLIFQNLALKHEWWTTKRSVISNSATHKRLSPKPKQVSKRMSFHWWVRMCVCVLSC
ncbi:major capsid protein P2 [Vibrio taketomensis]|uniref:major capsid protein P2 n=1 Tax=Vibrio taketomensis TaxID=2572923 RepID=UPI00138A498D|nr:major capsid protein P2 [Vibrio taketomensis]